MSWWVGRREELGKPSQEARLGPNQEMSLMRSEGGPLMSAQQDF